MTVATASMHRSADQLGLMRSARQDFFWTDHRLERNRHGVDFRSDAADRRRYCRTQAVWHTNAWGRADRIALDCRHHFFTNGLEPGGWADYPHQRVNRPVVENPTESGSDLSIFVP